MLGSADRMKDHLQTTSASTLFVLGLMLLITQESLRGKIVFVVII